uniref:Uncharacterized protein n=1 Tax=Rhizochromulina marina TaxID=1034831 RepID=A0A7S2RF28_9STRA|mmetsp:Transcript_15241/g.45135  ORF Transcript_15241/g.45135 Transcript_15241/m.45135 type:complete len:266 (+) Transcript_15241:94-891(+)
MRGWTASVMATLALVRLGRGFTAADWMACARVGRAFGGLGRPVRMSSSGGELGRLKAVTDRQGTVLIRHTQRTVPVDTELLEEQVRAILAVLELPHMDVGLWLSSDRTVRDWNTRYRGMRKSTDILSFPFYDQLRAPDPLPEMQCEDDMNLGDMIVSVPYVARACKRDHRDALSMGEDSWTGESVQLGGVSGEMMHYFSPQPRLALLVIHGICHLLGHDHEEDSEYALMRAEEERLIRGLEAKGLLGPRDELPREAAGDGNDGRL